jgi:uncharacterized protein (UPF0332 family)
VSEEPIRSEVIRYWWDKATRSLQAARREADAGDYAFAINRAYYTLFYAVSALLMEERRRFTKHSGVRAAFNREIIRTGRLSWEDGELYNQLFRDRQQGDYIEFTRFDAEYAHEKIVACAEFLRHLRPLLKSLPHDEDGIT